MSSSITPPIAPTATADLSVAELLRMLLVRQLEVDICILCSQSIEQPVHHEADLALADVIALTQHSPRQGQEPQTWEFSQHKDHLREIHDALPDGEGQGELLQVHEGGQL